MVEADAPAPAVWPTLRARDARRLIRFLVEAFGFEEIVVYGDQPDGSGDTVVHAELGWPLGGGVMLASLHDAPGTVPVDAPPQPGMSSCYVVTDAPDALANRAAAAGATLVVALHDTDYGSRDFTALDPEGNRWSFGTYAGEPRRRS